MAILIEYTLKAKEDIDHFKSSGQTQILKKIRGIVEAIAEHPYEGIGKPEPLKHNLQGLWSRRINIEHRLVYEVDDECFSFYHVGVIIKYYQELLPIFKLASPKTI